MTLPSSSTEEAQQSAHCHATARNARAPALGSGAAYPLARPAAVSRFSGRRGVVAPAP